MEITRAIHAGWTQGRNENDPIVGSRTQLLIGSANNRGRYNEWLASFNTTTPHTARAANNDHGTALAIIITPGLISHLWHSLAHPALYFTPYKNPRWGAGPIQFSTPPFKISHLSARWHHPLSHGPKKARPVQIANGLR